MGLSAREQLPGTQRALEKARRIENLLLLRSRIRCSADVDDKQIKEALTDSQWKSLQGILHSGGTGAPIRSYLALLDEYLRRLANGDRLSNKIGRSKKYNFQWYEKRTEMGKEYALAMLELKRVMDEQPNVVSILTHRPDFAPKYSLPPIYCEMPRPRPSKLSIAQAPRPRDLSWRIAVAGFVDEILLRKFPDSTVLQEYVANPTGWEHDLIVELADRASSHASKPQKVTWRQHWDAMYERMESVKQGGLHRQLANDDGNHTQ